MCVAATMRYSLLQRKQRDLWRVWRSPIQEKMSLSKRRSPVAWGAVLLSWRHRRIPLLGRVSGCNPPLSNLSGSSPHTSTFARAAVFVPGRDRDGRFSKSSRAVSGPFQRSRWPGACFAVTAVCARGTGLVEDMVRELCASRAAIIGRLAALADDAGDNFADMPLSRKKALLEAQAEAIDKVLAQVYAKAGDQHQDAGQDVIQASATQTVATMTELAGGAAVGIATGFTLDMAKAWFESSTVEGLTINDFLGKLQASARDRIISAGRRALIEGKGVQAAARMIRQEATEGSVPGLEGLARTYFSPPATTPGKRSSKRNFPTWWPAGSAWPCSTAAPALLAGAWTGRSSSPGSRGPPCRHIGVAAALICW